MVAVISWSFLDGCCHFLEPFGWLLLFCRAFWMVAIFFFQQDVFNGSLMGAKGGK